MISMPCFPQSQKVRITAWMDSPTGYKALGAYTKPDFLTLYGNKFIDAPNGFPVPIGQRWLEWSERRTVKGGDV